MHELLFLMAVMPPPDPGIGGTATVFAIVAAAVVILGGVTAMIRAIWRVAAVMRDNTIAVRNLVRHVNRLTASAEKMLRRIEGLERAGHERNVNDDP